jgi:hypothetical protein
MSNEDLPLSAIDAFANKALSVGAYNAPLHANLTASLKLVLDYAKKSDPKVEQAKVSQFLGSVDALLDDYGGQTKASPASITTYKWRAKRLLQDFVKYNDGDFMAWKNELAKKNKGAAAKAAKKPKPQQKAAPVEQSNPIDAQLGDSVHVIRLPGGRSGRLSLPDPISKREIVLAWKQLAAYKALLETIAGVDDSDDDDPNDEEAPTE